MFVVSIYAEQHCLNIYFHHRLWTFDSILIQAPLECDEDPQSDDWPPNGSIVFNQYSTCYRKELDLVVKNISINIKGGEKVSYECGDEMMCLLTEQVFRLVLLDAQGQESLLLHLPCFGLLKQ